MDDTQAKILYPAVRRANPAYRKIYWLMGLDQHEFSYIFYTTGASQ